MTIEKYKEHREKVCELLLKAEKVLYEEILSDIALADVKYTGSAPKDDPIEKLIDHLYASLFKVDRFYENCLKRITVEKFPVENRKQNAMEIARNINMNRMKDFSYEWHAFLDKEDINHKFEMLKNKELYA